MLYLDAKAPLHYEHNNYKNVFRNKQLQDLEQGIDWDGLVSHIFPYYVKSQISPILLTVENMLRIYIVVRCFGLSPSGVEKALLQSDTLRDFALIDLERDKVPNESTISEFISLFMDQYLAVKIERALKLSKQSAAISIGF